MGDEDSIIITGFMGTGKTCVGKEVARRLDRSFVDMDAEIEARAGKSISRIFAEDSEPTFRDMEATLCEELSVQQGLVIATGGGALVDPANKTLMMKGSTVVCLTCDVEEILCRLHTAYIGNGIEERPLLGVADPHAEIERLLDARSEAYRAIAWQIDTTRLSAKEVAEEVIEIANVTTLSIRYPNGQYKIQIGNRLLGQIGGALRASGVPVNSRIAVVSNPVVEPLYDKQIEAALQSAGFQSVTCLVPDGEMHKTLATVGGLCEQLLAGGLDRSGTVLSLGGGVTGDVAGFAAATFMRGVRFIQVPTTLLAMVDASVGGKTGVDLPLGKNLIGSFKQPAVVIIDPTVLATLSAEEIRAGLAEVIKHSIIGDPDLFTELEAIADRKLRITDYKLQIVRALRVKIAIVEEDPFEDGRRAVLNLGHTVGHALERLSGFGLRHGEAISIGTVAAARIAVALGRATPSLADRIEAVLAAWGLPVQCPPFEANAVWKAMAHDKKRRGRALCWVLPRGIGEVEITKDVPPGIVRSVLHNMGARSM